MRVFLAGGFVVAGLLLPVNLFGSWLEHASPAEVALFGIGNALFCIVLCPAALFLFNTPFGRPTKSQTTEEYLQELEEQGLLVLTECQALRALQVEEYEDEGLHYFVEFADGSILYLNGQELYDYEPIEDDPELNQPRRFPCTAFTLRTHREEKFIVDIECRGSVIEPEYIAPYPKDFWKWEPIDGEIITDRTYDEIKQKIVGAGESVEVT